MLSNSLGVSILKLAWYASVGKRHSTKVMVPHLFENSPMIDNSLLDNLQQHTIVLRQGNSKNGCA